MATAGSKTWAEITGMGLATAGAFVCLFLGLRRLGPVRTSIVAAAEPLATTVLAFAMNQLQAIDATTGGTRAFHPFAGPRVPVLRGVPGRPAVVALRYAPRLPAR